jgi:EAL domain-containing protein (putative c-di-GMP-specific phosphodiesterase class I)
MYQAKGGADGGFRVFEPSMQDEVAERHAIREDLRLALVRGEMVNYYQPLVALEGRAVFGAEALVRWRHPERGLVAPGYFIRLAEDSGLIIPLGRWVLREACRQLREWQREFPNAAPLSVSVNLSAVQLRQPGFVDDVVAILQETGLEARCLTLEVTESTFMDDTRAAIARLRELRGLGVRLELDDFGMGFSSLSILRDLPLDGLKIDKSFVDGIRSATDRPAFLQAIVRLADALQLEMVGEGVEHQHQADALRAMGCRRGQGYLFSRPLPAAEMGAYLRQSTAWAQGRDRGVLALPARRRSD